MSKIRRRLIFVNLLILGCVLPGNAQRVILFGVDGLASEGILKANTPNIHALMKSGSWSLQARAVIPTISSPNWAAMMLRPAELDRSRSTAARPARHGGCGDAHRGNHRGQSGCGGPPLRARPWSAPGGQPTDAL